jgi:hypothetical protein
MRISCLALAAVLGQPLVSASQVAGDGKADQAVGCIQMVVMPAQSDATTSNPVIVRMTNRCGKDITAYYFRSLDSHGNEHAAFGQELLAGLVLTDVRGPTLFRVNASRDLKPFDPPDALFTPMVTAVIFSDCTRLGREGDLNRLVRLRTRQLARLQSERETLESVSDWGSTASLRRRTEDARIAGSASYPYLKNWTMRFERMPNSDAATWERVVTVERKRLDALIDTYASHLRGCSANPTEGTPK